MQGTYEQLLKDLNRLKEKLENQPGVNSSDRLSCVRCGRVWQDKLREGECANARTAPKAAGPSKLPGTFPPAHTL